MTKVTGLRRRFVMTDAETKQKIDLAVTDMGFDLKIDSNRKEFDGRLENGVLCFTIYAPPRTKKNHSQLVYKQGRSFVIPSKPYQNYLENAMPYMPVLNKPISYPVNVKALYYMDTRKIVDISGLQQGLHDLLVDYHVLQDDNSRIIRSVDGSRVLYDKENPRTEIEISPVIDDNDKSKQQYFLDMIFNYFELTEDITEKAKRLGLSDKDIKFLNKILRNVEVIQ